MSNNKSLLENAIIRLAEANGWKRYSSTKITNDELDRFKNGNSVIRDAGEVVLLGQTDDSDTYGIKDSDGDLLIAPYQAGSILQKESTEIYLRDVLIAAFDEIPDSYVQTIGIRM